MIQTDEKTTVSCEEVLNKIKKKDNVDLDNCRIKGDIKVDKPLLGTGQLESSINITNSVIEGGFHLEGIVFSKNINCEKTKFSGPVTLRDCRVDSSSEHVDPSFSLINCEFLGKIRIHNSVFTHFSMNDSKITKDAKFEGIIFQKTANFHRIGCIGQVHVTDCHFGQYANFNGGEFNGITYFGRTVFFYPTFFNADRRNKRHICTFHKKVTFQSVTFHRETFFDEAHFGDELVLKDAIFLSTLSLKDTYIQKFRDREIAYRKAKKASENHGLYSDATRYYFHEMVAIRDQKPWYIRYPELVLFDWFLGYGVKPERIILSWIGIVLGFAALAFTLKGITEVNGVDLVSDLINAVEFSIMRATTPGVIGFQVNDTFKIFAFIEALIGTYFWAGIIACIGKKFLRI